MKRRTANFYICRSPFCSFEKQLNEDVCIIQTTGAEAVPVAREAREREKMSVNHDVANNQTPFAVLQRHCNRDGLRSIPLRVFRKPILFWYIIDL